MTNYLPRIAEKTPYGYTERNPFDILFGDRVVFINDFIDDDVAGVVIAQLLALESKDSTSGISIYLNTPGGNVDSIFSVLDTIKYVNCPVSTVCLGQCSGSSVLLLVNGDKRMMLPNARVLLRQPATSQQFNKATDISIQSKELTRLRLKLEKEICEHSKISEDDIAKLTQHETILTADDCLNKGLIDEILTKRKTSED